MRLSYRLTRFWKFVVKNWHEIVLLISAVGFIVSSFLPEHGKWAEFFIFAGLIAALLTLIEIRVLLSEALHPDRYSSMRTARSDIIASIRQCISGNHKEPFVVHIIGGRTRTISEMLMEILTDIRDDVIHARNVKFMVYSISPEFLQQWSSSGISDIDTFKARNANYAQMVRTFTTELESYNDDHTFKSHNVSIEVVHYRCFPTEYAFLIGSNVLYWGAFTWNFDTEDFQGPENPCYYLRRDQNLFDDYYTQLLNKVRFLRLASDIVYTQYSPKVMSNVASDKDGIGFTG